MYNIDGVFTTNPYPQAVNGSLWTIPYEFFFYVILSASFFLRKQKQFLLGIFVTAYILAVGLFILVEPALHHYSIPFWHLEGQHLAELGAFFLSGTVWALFPLPTIATRQKLAGTAAILMIVCWYFGGYRVTQFLLLPVVVISFGTLSTSLLNRIGKYGDFSYGIYLWGFFIQQLLMHLFHLSLLPLMIFSILLTFLCGILSWHFVEKRALRYKLRQKAVAPKLVASS